ncbi:MAG: phytanoyl-CoA dioxygenase family protein [Planctomycetota bacterium]|nr:phytanoyl-CoA dioxygenase family protein [Planctomycetota bacterium]
MNRHATWKRQWNEEGYVVVRGLFPPERAARLLGILERILGRWRVASAETGKPGGGPDAISMRHMNHPGYFEPDNRHEFLELMEAGADPGVLDFVRTILGGAPLFRCFSHFFNPLHKKEDGNWHRDSQFGTPDPEEEKKAILDRAHNFSDGVQLQIPLVPSDDIEFVPGSHLRWDTPEELRVRLSEGKKHNREPLPGALRLALQPGDAAAFNSCGLHRGRYHADKPRRTLMLTYTTAQRAPFDYFTDQPWFLEPGYLDGLHPEARAFYERFILNFREAWAQKAEPQAAAI